MTSDKDSLGLVGTTIAGKYAVECVVGQGGFAIVYRAMHVLWKRPVAMKVFNALGQVAAEQRQKLLDDFIQEGALLADLSERSTAICQARDVGMLVTPKNENVPYMVLEWLEGRTLESVLETERAAATAPRSLETTIRLLDPIAEALALAHKKGVVHRDVKPANIFVLGNAQDPSPEGVKLLDFGIAKVVQDAQKMGFGQTAGHITSFTPSYGAPEQFNRAYGATGPWTDVFAFALVVTEVLAGREPLSGETLVQLAYASADDKMRPTPRGLGVGLSDEVEAVFQKAVAVKPEARFQTVGEFWTALRARALGESRMPFPAGLSVTAPLATSATVLAPAVAPGTGSPAVGGAPAVTHLPASPSLDAGASAPKSRAALVVSGAALVVMLGGGYALFGRARVTAVAVPSASAVRSVAVPSSSPSSAASSSTGASVVSTKVDCPPQMVSIPGGDFFMGSDEKDALAFEKPLHRVKVGPYCLDEFEVTVEEYKACSDRGACRRAGKENLWPGITAAQRKIYDPLCNIADPVGKAKHPINCVDWDQAREACEARGARLPTEAEWEFAARGPDGRIYPWGDDAPSARLLNACGKECVAWQKKQRDPDLGASMYDEDDGFPNTAPVGSFPKGKSRYGIQDVVGNVWEWVSDFYAEYDKASATAVSVDPKGPASGTDRVIRGGAWNGTVPSWVRPSFRYHAAAIARSHGFGFRCAKSP